MPADGATRGRAKKIAAPRGRGRRTDEERARLQQEETDRTRARDVQRAAELAAETREDERRRRQEQRKTEWKRGRGGFMGDRGSLPNPGQYGLSAGFAPSKSQSKSQTAQGGRSSGPKRSDAPPTRVKSEPDTESTISSALATPFPTFQDDDNYISSDQEDGTEAPRQNIDTINIDDDDKEVEYLGSMTKKTLRARPVRLVHRPHQDRGIQINADAGTAILANDIAANNPAQSNLSTAAKVTGKVFQGVWSDDEDYEDTAETLNSQQLGTEGDKDESPQEVRNRKGKDKQVQMLFQTEEDRGEYERQLFKAQTLTEELRQQPAVADEAAEDDAARREGQVYLFQFPPNLPGLKKINEDGTDVQETALGEEEIAPPEAGPSTDAVTIKNENGEQDAEQKPQIAPKAAAKPLFNLPTMPAGRVGKLRLHKSGKVTMDWGGSSYNISLGMQTSCVQEMVMLDIPPPPVRDSSGALIEPAPGRSIPFGQVRGKYVVTPDWDKLLPQWRKTQLSKGA